MKTPLASAMAELTGNLLGWTVEARYEILNENVNRAWDWGGGRDRAEALSDLKRVMTSILPSACSSRMASPIKSPPISLRKF
jgi:hypothetical protein